MSYIGPGIYQHYKGGVYEVLGLAVREETKEEDWVTVVVYRPLTPGSMLEGRPEDFWARELGDFNATVEIGEFDEGTYAEVPRFQVLDPGLRR